MSRLENTAESSSGSAEVKIKTNRWIQQFTVIPDSASSGTATVTAMPEYVDTYETVYDNYGDALTFTLDEQRTYLINGGFKRLRVDSSNSSDSFTLIIC